MLDSDLVSRRHAVIQRTGGGEFYLLDLGSRNGTFVNDERVSTPVALKDGDRISIGAHKLVLHGPTPTPASEPEPRQDGSQSGTETKALFLSQLVTVLVVDIRGFTELTRKLDQAVLCQCIATWFSHADQIFRRRGSWGMKYIGDGVMAMWLHQNKEVHHQDMFGILEGVAEFAKVTSKIQTKFGLPYAFSFGAGLNTGIASVGNAGSAEMAEYTAFGDAVNAAFRIEASTRQTGFDIALGETTFEILRGSARPDAYFERHTVHLKGYEKPIVLWAGSFDSLSRLLGEAGEPVQD